MNEMYNYDPETYHPSLCHSVYVTLDGCNLRLAYPRVNIPRQASFTESTHDTTFVRSRSFQLSDSKVRFSAPMCLFVLWHSFWYLFIYCAQINNIFIVVWASNKN